MRILVVEDEYLVARALAAEITGRGHEVAGPVSSASAALDLLARTKVHGALLDIRLMEETSFEVGDRLLAMGLPFCFITAYEFAPLPEKHANAVRLIKPLNAKSLDLALENFLIMSSDRRPPSTTDNS